MLASSTSVQSSPSGGSGGEELATFGGAALGISLISYYLLRKSAGNHLKTAVRLHNEDFKGQSAVLSLHPTFYTQNRAIGVAATLRF